MGTAGSKRDSDFKTDPVHTAKLLRRVGEIERELSVTLAELAAMPGGSPVLPGLYVVVEAAGVRAALRAVAIREIIRMVHLMPLPAARPHLLGSFLYRGQPVIVVDLAQVLGCPHQTGLDTHLLVLDASKPVVLAVDGVRSLAENPLLAGREEGPSTLPGAWSKSGLALVNCRVGKELLPLIDVGAVAALAETETETR